MTEKKRKWLLIFGVLVPVALVLSLTLPLVSQSLQKLPPPPPSPNPNGYDDLIKAGKMISLPVAMDQMDPDTLKKCVAGNQLPLALINAGLSNECRVTTQFNRQYLDLDHHFMELDAIKNDARLLLAAGRQAELDRRPGDAAQFYLQTVRLGNESARGGILIDQLVGSAGERIGAGALEKISGQLDAPASRATATALESLDAQRQTWDAVMQQEDVWSRRTFPGWRDRFAAMMKANSLKKMFGQAETKFDDQVLKTRQLILRLAARAYELDKGGPPANATDLVPAYLKAVPQDPFTGADVAYPPR